MTTQVQAAGRERGARTRQRPPAAAPASGATSASRTMSSDVERSPAATRSGTSLEERGDRVGVDLGARHQPVRRPGSGARPAATGADGADHDDPVPEGAPARTLPRRTRENETVSIVPGGAAVVDPGAVVPEAARGRPACRCRPRPRRPRSRRALELVREAAHDPLGVGLDRACCPPARRSARSTLLAPEDVAAPAVVDLGRGEHHVVGARPRRSISALSSRGSVGSVNWTS